MSLQYCLSIQHSTLHKSLAVCGTGAFYTSTDYWPLPKQTLSSGPATIQVEKPSFDRGWLEGQKILTRVMEAAMSGRGNERLHRNIHTSARRHQRNVSPKMRLY